MSQYDQYGRPMPGYGYGQPITPLNGTVNAPLGATVIRR